MELRRERGNEANAPPNAARIPERRGGGDCIQNVRGEGDLRWSVMDEGMIPGGLPAARREKPKAPSGAKGVRCRRGEGILFHPRTRRLLCIYRNKIKLAFMPLIDLNLGSWLPL